MEGDRRWRSRYPGLGITNVSCSWFHILRLSPFPDFTGFWTLQSACGGEICLTPGSWVVSLLRKVLRATVSVVSSRTLPRIVRLLDGEDEIATPLPSGRSRDGHVAVEPAGRHA